MPRPAKVESAATVPSVGPRPLCIDLFCGLGGWAEGFLAEGYDVVGFDIERHDYGTGGYPGQLVLQDVLTLHGSQFRNAAVIVASPPCQAYSYMAMPWQRAKREIAWQNWQRTSPWWTDRSLNDRFAACFRIAEEAGVPLVVENVRGAERWVGPARWHFGSYYLWGDVPALMPLRMKATNVPGFRFDGSGRSFQTASVDEGRKGPGGDWFKDGRQGQDACAEGLKWGDCNGKRFDERPKGNVAAHREGTKQGGNWWHDPDSLTRRHSSKSPDRKAASAQIAKIPLPLASHIARVFKPVGTPANQPPVEEQNTRDATTPCWLLAMRDADEDAERHFEVVASSGR
jgi:hypothetical protein